MKKSVLAITFASILVFSCSKKDNAAVQEENTTTTEQVQQAEEAAAADVIPYVFKASDTGDFVTAEVKGETATLKVGDAEPVELKKEGEVYSNDAYTLSLNGNESTLNKIGSEVAYTLISPLSYEYSAKGATDIKATYYSEGDKLFVKLEQDGQATVLPQTQAWAKGAEYKDNTTTWTNKGDNTAEYVQGDTKVVYTSK
ncbi:hypothetical protein EQP59_06420 [Ornithobacterium rhinotracheale]|uniref:C-type lysozyme inhibitor domain-containing protein n=1 Tax=Ornithobacterium rhinotracheale TaxID=28251 RepID=A0A3R5US67_ORNRH|nr:MliC family protein [Ornithobacterium rhinotracheale]QAR30997.1 hypothetical protein EQP59_06420 [Ornithobacterium rhinotracheale]